MPTLVLSTFLNTKFICVQPPFFSKFSFFTCEIWLKFWQNILHTERHISKTAQWIFTKFGMKLGINRGSNVTRPFFKYFASFSRKPLKGCQKTQIWRNFRVFRVFQKNASYNFALILPKCAPNALKILTKFYPNLSSGSGVIVEKWSFIGWTD